MRVEAITDKDIIRECLLYLESKSLRNKVLFAIGIYTGLRVSDILKLRVKDIYNKNRIQVKQTKTGNYVYIPIHKELKKIIKEYVSSENLKQYHFLIKSRKGKNSSITRNQAYHILQDMSEAIGIDRVGTHSMRKTCGYHLYISSDKDIGLVMQVLGQKDQSSTLRYIGVTELDIQNSLKKLSFK